MASKSLRPLQRHRAGLPAGTSEIAPTGGGTDRFTPSYCRSSSIGGRRNRTSQWWVMAGGLSSKTRSSRQRAASRPTHPSRTLDRTASNGKSLRQSRAPIGSPPPGSSCCMTCFPHNESCRRHRLIVRISARATVGPLAELVNTTLSIVGRLGLGPQPSPRQTGARRSLAVGKLLKCFAVQDCPRHVAALGGQEQNGRDHIG